MYWRENARERATNDPDLILAAHQFILAHFGGCKLRASEFFQELAKPTLVEGD